MLAWLQRATTLGLVLLAAAWVALAWRAGHPIWAVGGALLIVFFHALVLAIEFIVMRQVHGEDPTPRPTLGQTLRAWAGEVFAAVRVFCWRQPFRSKRWPDCLPEDAGGRVGVVLVHGFVCNRGVWNAWLARLSERNQPFTAVNMPSVFGSIDEGTSEVDAAVARMAQTTGRAPLIVAHSMGGLVVRQWWCGRPDADVRHVITLGTPHQGTWLARFAMSLNGRQMQPGSPWLQAMGRGEPLARAQHFTCFYSHCDNIVFPPVTAMLPGADNRHLAGVAHVQMVDRPEPWIEALRWLS